MFNASQDQRAYRCADLQTSQHAHFPQRIACLFSKPLLRFLPYREAAA
jgi:hypothetical protein